MNELMKITQQRDILLRALNRIGDVFEYQYKAMSHDDLKAMVEHNMAICTAELKALEEQGQGDE